jgi:hypothetical protein
MLNIEWLKLSVAPSELSDSDLEQVSAGKDLFSDGGGALDYFNSRVGAPVLNRFSGGSHG